jgi:Tfp pilus assembly protein PilN
MEIKLNLASRPYLNRRSVRLWLLFAALLILLLLFFNGMNAYRVYSGMQQLDERFAELEQRVPGKAVSPTGYSAANYAALKDEIAQARAIVAADQFRWTSLLGRLEEVTPATVSISSLQPDFEERSVRVTGVARTVSAVTRFMDNLLTSQDLSKAYLQRHGELEQPSGQTLVGFSLIIEEAF